MSAVIPRWEFRTFGRQFGTAEEAFARLEPGAVQESDELYLLTRDGEGPGNVVKIRHDLMDVKSLREVSSDGLERWEPVMKVAFPMATADMERVREALDLPAPAVARDDYTRHQFIDEVATRSGSVRPVRVHKRRVRYTIQGCTAEVSEVVADGRTRRTIAIESEDAAAVAAAVRAVGLDGYANTNYPRGLAALLEDRDARYAVIDVGTNSVKFHIGQRLNGDTWRAIVDRAEVTRLGEGLREGGEIAPGALERTIAAIAGMVDEAHDHGAVAIAAVGTAGLRAAGDRDAAVDAIRARAGVTVDVISGEEESRLAYLAAQAGLGLGDVRLIVFDAGGGSTQFTFGQGGTVDERFSVPAGAVRITERFGLSDAVSSAVLDEARAAIAEELAGLDEHPAPDVLVGMGGAVTNLTAVMHRLAVYDPTAVQGTVLETTEIDRQIELYRSQDAAGRRTIVGLQPARADVILAGACIVRTVMERLGRTSLVVSDRGLRHGVLVERFGQ